MRALRCPGHQSSAKCLRGHAPQVAGWGRARLHSALSESNEFCRAKAIADAVLRVCALKSGKNRPDPVAIGDRGAGILPSMPVVQST